jgi:hypothetical protein
LLRLILDWAKVRLRRADATAISTTPSFQKLNDDWNADPNGPDPIADASGPDLLLRFLLNSFVFEQFSFGDKGVLRFVNCSRYRLGRTNMDGWYYGQCRYSKIAPEWGEFYEITGEDPYLDEPSDWVTINKGSNSSRHFLFYFRDETFECIAADWAFEPIAENALYRHFQST